MFYEGCTFDEIRAFRALENEIFDFGEGPLKMKGLFGSEDAYYEMSLPEYRYANNDENEHSQLEELSQPEYSVQKCISEREFIEVVKGLSRIRHHGKVKAKRRLDEFDRLGFHWTLGYERDGYKVRSYRGKRSKYYKRYSNKRTRQAKGLPNGCQYKKLFDFQDEMFG